MGLTIKYALNFANGSADAARQAIERLRQFALTLPLQSVGPLLELNGDGCDYQNWPADDPKRWLLVQSTAYAQYRAYQYNLTPKKLIAFETLPGDGCEAANFGLCRYPAIISIRTGDTPIRRVSTKLRGWSWRSFCKTQYAGNPECGGVENFLRRHLLVVRMLEHARELGILTGVSDEGGYWESRDLPTLARRVGRWDGRIAAKMKRFREGLRQNAGRSSQASDIEHVEAAGSR